MSNVIIRPLRSSDEPEWRRLWDEYLKFYETSVTQDVYETYFARLLGDDPKDYSCLIAEIGAKPVGLTHFVFHRHGWKIENVCYLQDLYTDPSHRGRGIGRALTQAVYAAADAAGAPGVYWMTNQGNLPARRLYDSFATLTPFIKYARS